MLFAQQEEKVNKDKRNKVLEDDGEEEYELWPGDVDRNGIVSGVDLLYIGIGLGETGPAREVKHQNIDWYGRKLKKEKLWKKKFKDGTDYAFADTWGDGQIGTEDFEALEGRFDWTYGQSHPNEFTEGSPGVDPPIFLTTNEVITHNGQAIEFQIHLGDADLPVKKFYGITFKIKYNTSLVRPGSPSTSIAENSWLDPPGFQHRRSNIKGLSLDNSSLGRTQLAVTRLNKKQVSGAGSIGTYIVIVENVDFFDPSGIDIHSIILGIEDVKLIDKQFNEIPVDASIAVIGPNENDVMDGRQQSLKNNLPEIEVYPNPSSEFLVVEHPSNKIQELELIDQNGQTIKRVRGIHGSSFRLDLNGVSGGAYWLRLHTPKGIQLKSILIEKSR